LVFEESIRKEGYLNTETLGARQAGCGDGSGDPLLPTFYTHARTHAAGMEDGDEEGRKTG
jgi:hypothetical protein